MPSAAPSGRGLEAPSPLPPHRAGTLWCAAMQSPPLDDKTLRALVRAAESPLTAPVALRLLYAESGIAKALALSAEPDDHPPLDDRPLAPAETPE